MFTKPPKYAEKVFNLIVKIQVNSRNALTHWEELLQFVSEFIFSKHCGCTPRGVRGVKRPGRPSSQNGVK